MDQLVIEKEKREYERAISDFRDVVGPIVLLADPSLCTSLANLLGIEASGIDDGLKYLYSVLDIPSDRQTPVRLLQLSETDMLSVLHHSSDVLVQVSSCISIYAGPDVQTTDPIIVPDPKTAPGT